LERYSRINHYICFLSNFEIRHKKNRSSRVAPLGWITPPEQILIDQALNDYQVVWAASGHPHAVYPTIFAELVTCTGATPMVVGD
jgi:hypothetical protein